MLRDALIILRDTLLGAKNAAERTNFGRPSRTYPTDEEQLSYELRLYLLIM